MLTDEESDHTGLTYPGLVDDVRVDGPGVEITFPNETSRIMRFANADVAPNALTIGLYHPCHHKMCAVARGAGYEIDVEQPSKWRDLPILPIMGCLAQGASIGKVASGCETSLTLDTQLTGTSSWLAVGLT